MELIRKWVAPLGVIAGSLYLWYLTLGFRTAYAQSETFGPSFFPQLVLAGLILVSVLQIVRLALAREQPVAERTAEPFHWGDLIAAVAISAAYVALMKATGFLPSTFLFQTVLLFVIFRQRSLKILLGVPAILTTIYFLIFVRALEMPLPQGHGWFREFSQIVYF